MTNVIEIQNLSQYLSEINKISSSVMFRGEKEYYEKSLPSYFRESSEFQRIGIDKFVDYMFDYIKHSPHLSTELPHANVETISKIEKQHVLQHYEMPTKLLDVSKNPLIALYFSCVDKFGKKNDKDGYVKVYDVVPIPYNKEFSRHNKHHTAFKMPLVSIRSKVQNGDVIYFEKAEELEPFMTFKIPSENKEIIINELDMLGICYETLFPSLKNEMAKLKIEFENINDSLQMSTSTSMSTITNLTKSLNPSQIDSSLEKSISKLSEQNNNLYDVIDDWESTVLKYADITKEISGPNSKDININNILENQYRVYNEEYNFDDNKSKLYKFYNRILSEEKEN